ncbi:hypothetical protein KIH74_29800 [Kineosporia sp. J2-2]|uniref:Prevent-host-death family protein n=1 Tax=Kineosporia corallincola TaxID=2835133 RepID=A0ABS5TPY8_9ACTN|nr:hypothetical protein [Kineosporia corallincola]MBT0773175.1 hypothetical protein [Kineosporia corallincola]
MSAEPIASGPELSPGVRAGYDVIHLGGESAVIVPMADFLRLRALEEAASQEALEDAEDLAAFRDWETREAAGTTSYMTMDEVREQLGLER